MSHAIIPFKMLAAGVQKISTGRLPWERAHVKMYVFGATPAYLWIGRDDLTQALAAANVASPEPDYDLAGHSFTGMTPEVDTEAGGTSVFMIYASGAAEGYLAFSRCDCHDHPYRPRSK